MNLAVKVHIESIYAYVYMFSDYSMPVIMTDELLDQDPLVELELLKDKDAELETGQSFFSLDDIVRWMDTRNLWNGGERAMILRTISYTIMHESKLRFYQIEDDNE